MYKISNKFNWDNTTRMFDLLLKNNGYKDKIARNI